MDSNHSELYKSSSRITKHVRISIFEEITTYSLQNKSRNLAQGFPDWETPKFVRDYMSEAIEKGENQYIRVAGHPVLDAQIARTYGPKLGREIDPLTEITVANGATGILNNAFAAFLEPGDEVIVIEPVFEFYFSQAEIYGANVKFFPLTPPTADSDKWTYDWDKLATYFNEKTRMILLNTPHNPTGTMMTKEDIEKAIKILEKWPRVIVLADEVYEHNVYDGHKHLRLATFPGMWDRTISIYSGGKIFSCTGWRVGWGIGPVQLIKPMTAVQNWTQFCLNRPNQVAFSEALKFSLEQPYEGKGNYYEYLTDLYARKKEELLRILRSGPLDIRVLNPDGGYFVIVDITKSIPAIPKKYFYKVDNGDNTPVGDYQALENPDYSTDYAFTRWLTVQYGITPVPMFAFYNQTGSKGVKELRGQNMVRFAICKSDETLNDVAARFVKN